MMFTNDSSAKKLLLTAIFFTTTNNNQQSNYPPPCLSNLVKSLAIFYSQEIQNDLTKSVGQGYTQINNAPGLLLNWKVANAVKFCTQDFPSRS